MPEASGDDAALKISRNSTAAFNLAVPSMSNTHDSDHEAHRLAALLAPFSERLPRFFLMTCTTLSVDVLLHATAYVCLRRSNLNSAGTAALQTERSLRP